MATSRHRKNHKKKLKARKEKLENSKNKVAKMQRQFLMNLIQQEKEKGLFENTQNLNTPDLQSPATDGPIVEGPII